MIVDALKSSFANPDHGWTMVGAAGVRDATSSHMTYQIQSSVKEAILIISIKRVLGDLSEMTLTYGGVTFNILDEELASLIEAKASLLSSQVEDTLLSLLE